jgi:hypothetical protein
MFSTWQEYSNAATDPVVLLLLWCRLENRLIDWSQLRNRFRCVHTKKQWSERERSKQRERNKLVHQSASCSQIDPYTGVLFVSYNRLLDWFSIELQSRLHN